MSLKALGIPEQWGTEPLSAAPRRIAQVTEWVRSGGALLAVTDAGDAGCLVVGTAPSYVSPKRHPSATSTCWSLAVTRGPAAWVDGCWSAQRTIAQRLDVDQLRVDCYAGGDQALVRF